MGLLGDWAKSKRMSQPVRGTAQIVAASMPPHDATSSNCSLNLVVSAEGMEPTAVERDVMVSVRRWPTPGMTVPVTVDLDDPTRLKFHWREIGTSDERAKDHAEQLAEMMRGGAGAAAGQSTGADLAAAIQQATGATDAAARPNQPAPDDVAAQIEKLSKLRDYGSLSDEEFSDAKRKLLKDL